MDFFVQLTINSVIAGSIYTLIALSFNLIYVVTKFFNLAHGIMVAVGAYSVFFLAKILQINIYVSVLTGILLAALFGYGLDRFVYLPLRKRKASKMVFFVASLGAMIASQAIISITFGSKFKTLSEHIDTQKIYHVFGGSITQIQLVIVVVSLLVMSGLVLLLYKTQFGKEIRAIGDDEEAARIIGINTNRVIGQVFFIGSGIAALAGVLVGFNTGLVPTMGLNLLLKGVVAVITGGIGNIYGALMGSFLLGGIENFGVWIIASEWKDLIAFALLIVFLIFRPRGIMNK